MKRFCHLFFFLLCPLFYIWLCQHMQKTRMNVLNKSFFKYWIKTEWRQPQHNRIKTTQIKFNFRFYNLIDCCFLDELHYLSEFWHLNKEHHHAFMFWLARKNLTKNNDISRFWGSIFRFICSSYNSSISKTSSRWCLQSHKQSQHKYQHQHHSI